ncbi:MAG: hypothetical protein ACRDXX_01810 [Stackebrandtia sp.]
MRFKKMIFASAAAGVAALGLFAQSAATAAEQPGGGDAATGGSDASVLETDSIPCYYGADTYLNLSWETGIDTTTIYYNNHCSEEMEFRPWSNSYSECVKVPADTKSSKKVDYMVTDVTDPC